nr:hypothetical protein [bacterium]
MRYDAVCGKGATRVWVPETPEGAPMTYPLQQMLGAGEHTVTFTLVPAQDGVAGTVAWNSVQRLMTGAREMLMPLHMADGFAFSVEGGPRVALQKGQALEVKLSFTLSGSRQGNTYSLVAGGVALVQDAPFQPPASRPTCEFADIGVLGVVSLKGGFDIRDLSHAILGAVDGGDVEEQNPVSTQDGRVFRVGPGHRFHKIQDVLACLKGGDVVEVEGGCTYPGHINLPACLETSREKPIMIRGIARQGKRPVIKSTHGNYVFQVHADHVVLENMEIIGNLTDVLHRAGKKESVFTGRNAGDLQTRNLHFETTFFGVHQVGDNLTVRRCLVRDNRQGIISSDFGSGSITVEYCECYHNGAGGGDHNLYLATDEVCHPEAVARVQYCYIHDSVSGNGLKTRAARNEIYFNWFENNYHQSMELIGPDPGYQEGVGYTSAEKLRAIDPTYGEHTVREDSDVVGNVVIEKIGAAVRCGGDGTGSLWSMPETTYGHGMTFGRYRFVNNTFIRHGRGNFPCIRLEFGVESVECYNNVFYRHPDAAGNMPIEVVAECLDQKIVNTVQWASGKRCVKGSHNWVQPGAKGVPQEWTDTLVGEDPGLVDVTPGTKDVRVKAGSPLAGAGVQMDNTVATWPDWHNLLPDFGHWNEEHTRVLSDVPDESKHVAAMHDLTNRDNAFPRPLMQLENAPVDSQTMQAPHGKVTGRPNIGAFTDPAEVV